MSSKKQGSGGWNIFEPQGPSGRYSKYDAQLKIIVSGERKAGGRAFYLPKAVLSSLGDPEYITIVTRGSEIGLKASAMKDRSYKVMQSKSKNGNSKGSHFLNLTAFGKVYRIVPGVYDAKIENGIVVFDTEDTPSRP